MCGEIGRTEPANIVDHKTPHKGDLTLFWDVNNWQPLCKPCHDRHKQREDKGGRAGPRFTADGRVIWAD